MPQIPSAFHLPERLAAKADPSLIATDERRFAEIAARVDEHIAELGERLAAERRAPGGGGQQAMDRDLEIRRIAGRLRTLRRFSLDLCLGRMVGACGGEPVYIGRLGLADAEGRRLLVDWRTPAAEPFFAATLAEPMGLSSRRRYRWAGGRVVDYWDEAFAADGSTEGVALDEDSSFIASLGASRSPRMRDVLSTIQADQDAIIRADSHGPLVVDGGPGTGKTVVALHRAAYLMYADPRVSQGRGGVLFVGPNRPYLDYVSDVLPNLGEDGVQSCTLRDLVVEGADAVPETDIRVAGLKASTRLFDAIEAAVDAYEQPPRTSLAVETPWADVDVAPVDWAAAFEAADPGLTHNEARDQVWGELVDALVDEHTDEEVPAGPLRRALMQDEGLRRTFARAWPLLDPAGVVGDLWSVPGYLERCAPWLDPEELRVLQRTDPVAWTTADLPILDAARHRIGDPAAARRAREREAALAVQGERMSQIVDGLIAADDDGEGLVTMLRTEDARTSLVDDAGLPALDPDALAGPFAHVVVDEAQELDDADWAMLVRRCPSRSFTIVGDPAQARRGFTESWEARLERVDLGGARVSTLRINYRTPEEIMAEAAPVIRAALPGANVPTSIRASGEPVVFAGREELGALLDRWAAEHPEGTACVIGDPEFVPRERVRSLDAAAVKGLEFDLVVLVDPESYGDGIRGAVDRYVAMTRSTRSLVVLSGPDAGARPTAAV